MSEEYNGRRMLPYEGEENYIFISYSHRNTNIVLPILEYLEKEGFRFWYDEGIDPGSEWPESIATHLANAKVCLAFISKDSLKSNNCRREINFALSKNIEFLSVILEEVEMSPGVEMQISSYQSLIKYKYKTEEDFLKRFVKVETIQSCKEIKQIEVRQEEVKEIVEKIEEPKIIDVETVVKETKKQQPKIKKPKKEKVKTVKTANKNSQFIGLGIVLCLVVALVFVFMPKKITIQGIEYEKNNSTYNFNDISLTSEDVSKILTFKEATSVYFDGVTFENKSYELLKDMEEVTAIYMTNCNGIDDLSFVSEMESLYILKLENCGLTDQMVENLNPKALFTLDLSNNKLTKVPEGLGTKLRELDLSNNKISITRAFEEYINLEILDISNNSIISFRGIDNCTKLRELNASNNKLSELNAIQNIIHLEYLDASNNKLSTLSSIKYMEELRVLNISGNERISDFSNIANSSATLEKLGLQNLTITNLDMLKDCTKLTKLYADNSYIEDIRGLKNCVNLTTLTLSNNKITDISSLSNLTKLQYGNFADNQINSLVGLENMCKEQKYARLSFQNNQISSLDGIPNAKDNKVVLCGNPISDIRALKGIEGSEIAFDGVASFPVEQLKDVSYVAVYMIDLDVSIQKEVEDNLSGKLRTNSMNEMLEKLVGNYFELSL